LWKLYVIPVYNGEEAAIGIFLKSKIVWYLLPSFFVQWTRHCR
jgi:hypothetical protein